MCNGWIMQPDGTLVPGKEQGVAEYDGGFHGAVEGDESGTVILDVLWERSEDEERNLPYARPVRPPLSSEIRTRPTAELVEMARLNWGRQSEDAYAELFWRFRGRLVTVVRRVLNLAPGDRWPAHATVWMEEGLYEAIRKFTPHSTSAAAEAYFVKYAEKAVRSRVVDAHRARPWVSLMESDDEEGSDPLFARIPDPSAAVPGDGPPVRFPWEGKIAPRDLVRQLRQAVAPESLERRLLELLMPPPPEEPDARRFHCWYSNASMDALAEALAVDGTEVVAAFNRLQAAVTALIPSAA